MRRFFFIPLIYLYLFLFVSRFRYVFKAIRFVEYLRIAVETVFVNVYAKLLVATLGINDPSNPIQPSHRQHIRTSVKHHTPKQIHGTKNAGDEKSEYWSNEIYGNFVW